MATIPSKLATEAHPFDGPSFDPLKRNLRKRGEAEAAAAVVVEKRQYGEQVLIGIVTRVH